MATTPETFESLDAQMSQLEGVVETLLESVESITDGDAKDGGDAEVAECKQSISECLFGLRNIWEFTPSASALNGFNPCVLFPPPLTRQDGITSAEDFDLTAGDPIETKPCAELHIILETLSLDTDTHTREGFHREQIRELHVQCHQELSELLAQKKVDVSTVRLILKAMLGSQKQLCHVLYDTDRLHLTNRRMYMQTYRDIYEQNYKMYMVLQQLLRDTYELTAVLPTIAIFCY